MASYSLNDILQAIADRGRQMLTFPARPAPRSPVDEIVDWCERLLSGKGEASGMALAQHILRQWNGLTAAQRLEFMLRLNGDFGPRLDRLENAIRAYGAEPDFRTLRELHDAAEPRRQELIRRLNLAPGGMTTLVAMREALLAMKRDNDALDATDSDFHHLFSSWFNRGFLDLRQIDWSTPAHILEKIIRYEAVHEIRGWDELRRRLKPEDRRCFAFFHPQLADEPLIFVEVALTTRIPDTIDVLLNEDRPYIGKDEATTAVFYSISNCQAGLTGVSFGNFLIKQVVDILRHELPLLKTYVTLSPAPGFGEWLARELRKEQSPLLSEADREILRSLDDPAWPEDAALRESLSPLLARLAAVYFSEARNHRNKPLDPVARFHLGNGASLDRINILGDRSQNGMRQSHGLMVNYLYELDRIEANHERFATQDTVVVSEAVDRQRRAARHGGRGIDRKAAAEYPV
jgi:malonyl-CoA decarboxylase